MIKDICIVVVWYYPNPNQINRFEKLSEKLDVIVIDNSKCGNKTNEHNYIPLHGNKGIAAAHNVGIRWAKEKGYKYVLLLDQDSILEESFVQNLYKDFMTIKDMDSKVGFIGPVFIDETSKQEYKNYTDKNEKYTRTSALMASGCLISMECLDAVGGMDESLFIDLVDFEWCWRAGSKGFTGYMTRNVTMTHSIGREYHNWHGFVLGLSAPFRYYYQYRNSLWLIRRSYVPRGWKIKSLVRRPLDMILVPLVSKQGWKVLKNMLKGTFDGLFKENVLRY